MKINDNASSQGVTSSNGVEVGTDNFVSTPTAHEAAIQQPEKTRLTDKVELIVPKQGLDPSRLGNVGQELNNTLDMMSLLFEIAKRMRELGILQRDTENKASIDAQKSQVDEMRHGAKLMIAMAVVSGLMTLGSGLIGSFSSVKNSQAVKQQKTLESNIAGRNKLIESKLQQLGKSSDADRAAIGKVWNVAQDADKSTLKSLTLVFESRNSNQQLLTSVMKSLEGMSNNSVQVEQGLSQAKAKEHEVGSSIAQHEKQKSEDQISLNNNFMKDVLQLLQQLYQNHVQALRAATGVV
ncbi:YopD family type III secretion system translocon subunit [Photorhabdus laumondii subsp. laumondii]|uniref:Photorhabdus luminescens subsp. laumondii TTO1 complete genome segment 13/17 n=2 Tax=Photorhabdus laumondii subsp. laumondii TaxID=141679 RepID=Q7N0X4_PHOLL|nr:MULTISPECIES: YopD family type III secretion system translocon subunit [Photorhabdus]AWK43375.1 AopD protein [Photorhabdus laumondii subsp. laumondii]AXG44047.1 AopD protein [Photorhabdus laumondii subsp. laumondii]AXG48680.1 AopD protein [Photorhabdus laumondii subsp. laumondii]KTL63078.1 AopD protein [Photorhabdus laumondii subsp. laumondii]MCC8383228.1 YopD family type III secretion system translocon subunit [Photorhabdus laumondii]